MKIKRKQSNTSSLSISLLSSSSNLTLASPTITIAPQTNVALTQKTQEASSNFPEVDFGEQFLEPELMAEKPLGHDISKISLRPQARLSVSHPQDPYEQEADQVAQKIMRMNLPANVYTPKEVESVSDNIIIQRDDVASLPPVPNYQLTPPSFTQPSDPASRYRLGGDMHFQLNPQLQAMAIGYAQQQVSPATIQPALAQVSLGNLATAGSNPTPAIPNPFATPAPAPSASPLVPAGRGTDTPRQATSGDLLGAILAVPSVNSAVTSLQTQAGDRISQDWGRLQLGEKGIVISTLAMISGGALAGVISDPAARQLGLSQLNGRVLPVPGLNWLHLEMNTQADGLMLGFHLDVGRLLPPGLGFGTASMNPIGGSPQPQPLPGSPDLQRKPSEQQVTNDSTDIESQLNASKNGGSTLSNEVRGFMEPRFGVDFSNVRVHTDSASRNLSSNLNAQAFTYGNDIYFGAGKLPGNNELTAHELTHVVQQMSEVQTSSINRKPQKETKTKPSIINRTTIQRFESNEHKAMGDNATKDMVELAPNFQVTFGDLTAIADFFGSVAQIKDFAKSEFGIQQIKYVIYVKIRGQKERESEFSDEVKNAVSKRYYTLAGSNYTHFTNPKEGDNARDLKDKVNDEAVEKDEQGNPVIGLDGKPKKVPVNNAGSYRQNHELALKEAYEAGKKGTSKNEAMLYEGFASHFLTDAYAGGHMRPERISIKEHWDKKVPMFWINLKWWMAECIANHLNNQSSLVKIATEQYLWEQARDTFNKVVAAKGIPDLTFGDAISGAVHDNDNEEGVNAQVGNEVVKLVGDGAVLDEKNRLLAAGADTMAKAIAGVKASLQEVEMAYKGKEPSSILIDGLYRAEQLWPKPLADNDPKQDNKTLNWKVESVAELLADPRMKEAIAKFANEKAEILGAEIQMEKPFREEKELAMKEGALARLKGSPDSVAKTFLEILNYTPGSVASLGGVGGHDKDDNAVEYYQEVLKTKGGIESLASEQREKLIQNVLNGATMGDEQAMVVELLKTATSEQANKLIDKIGWHRLWKEIDGEICRQLIQTVGLSYWAKQSYENKRAEVKFLADGRTNDLAQETIIIILRTCTSEEVRLIDEQIGGLSGLNFDLDGHWNKEFQRMKAPLGDYPEPNKDTVPV